MAGKLLLILFCAGNSLAVGPNNPDGASDSGATRAASNAVASGCPYCQQPLENYDTAKTAVAAAERARAEALQRLTTMPNKTGPEYAAAQTAVSDAQQDVQARITEFNRAKTSLLESNRQWERDSLVQLVKDSRAVEEAKRAHVSLGMIPGINPDDPRLSDALAAVHEAEHQKSKSREVYEAAKATTASIRTDSNEFAARLGADMNRFSDTSTEEGAQAAVRRANLREAGLLPESAPSGGGAPANPLPGKPGDSPPIDREKSLAAKNYLDEILKQDPKNADALSKRALNNWNLGDKAAACADAEAALALDSRDQRSLGITKLGCRGGLKLASNFSSKPNFQNRVPGRLPTGDEGPARQAPAEKLPGLPSLQTGAAYATQVARSQSLTNLSDARAAEARGDLREAGALALESLKQNPRNIDAYKLLAKLYAKTNDYRHALQAAERALLLNPEDGQALSLKSQALFKLGDSKGALAAADEALRLNPGDAYARVMRGYALGALNDKEGMLRELAQAAALDPRFGAVLTEAQNLSLDEFLAHLPGEQRPAKKPVKSGPPLWLIPLGIGGLGALFLLLSGKKTETQEHVPAPARNAAIPTSQGLPTLRPNGHADVGAVIGGKYELKRRIGEGGMGVVFEGRDSSLDRKVAVKRMKPELMADPRSWDAFVKEAKIVSHLSHPYIVSIHDVVEEGGESFLVFDFVDGKTLSQILHERGRMSFEEARKVMVQVCEAIDFAHKNKVLHRDLKPANIMLDQNGYARVMDFGVAREAKDSLTKQTTLDASGTPLYMAPEQHLGRAVKASDVFSLAVCLYEMVTGKAPFTGADLLAQKERKTFPSARAAAPELPKRADDLFSAALEPDPLKRVADAAELAELLKQV